MCSAKIFRYNQPFVLESGKILSKYHLAYHTYGKLNDKGDNAVWVFHALTANSDAADWWKGLVGAGSFLNPEEYFIVCVNIPGSFYGSLSPLDINPNTGTPYYHDFPMFTTRDMIRSYQPLRKYLGINRIKIGIGGSMGGQQLLEWAIEEPELFENIVPIATGAFHSAWGIALDASQRMCIELDPTWKEQSDEAGKNGLRIARSIALLSYRNYGIYTATQEGVTIESSEKPIDKTVYKAESYQHYQGEKLINRFNAFSYYLLTKSTDAHDLGRGRESREKALSRIQAKTLIIGITSDLLFPPVEQVYLSKHIPKAKISIIDSIYGHDGFLLETGQITDLLNNFLDNRMN
jgi:homoserine O-acetyltransferase